MIIITSIAAFFVVGNVALLTLLKASARADAAAERF